MQLHIHINTERSLDLVEAGKVIDALSGGRVEAVTVASDAPKPETAQAVEKQEAVEKPAAPATSRKKKTEAAAPAPAAPPAPPAAEPAPASDDNIDLFDGPAVEEPEVDDEPVTLDDVRAVIRTLMQANADLYRDKISAALGKFKQADGAAVTMLPQLQAADYKAARDAISALGKK